MALTCIERKDINPKSITNEQHRQQKSRTILSWTLDAIPETQTGMMGGQLGPGLLPEQQLPRTLSTLAHKQVAGWSSRAELTEQVSVPLPRHTLGP